MSSTARLFLCLGAGVVLCQCSGTDKEKKTSPADMTLAQRSMLKPNENQRSSFEKYMTGSKSSKGQAGSYFQKQVHQSKSFNGGDSYAGQKQFKTGQSWFGKSRATTGDMTYDLGKKQVSGLDGFKTDSSRFSRQLARENSSSFDASNSFKTNSALRRSELTPSMSLPIENYNDKGGKKSAYSEDEVRKLLNRN